MILVAVGTYIHGFDALVEAADGAVGELGLPGFAQIGHSRVIPRHLAWERFLPPSALAGRIVVSAPILMGHHFLVGVIAEFMSANPRVEIDLWLDDRFVDLVAEGIDVALRLMDAPREAWMPLAA